jgi:hypothetical protein
MKAFAFALWMVATVQAGAQAQQHFPVTAQQVAHALELQGVDVADGQISLAASIVAESAEPQLQIEGVQPLRGGHSGSGLRAEVRLSCAQPHDCIPFYAFVTLPDGTELAEKSTSIHALFAKRVPALPVAIRAGGHATLIVETARMHIRVPVISLQNGAVGAQIHVTSPDHKQTYRATVLGPSLLSGSL